MKLTFMGTAGARFMVAKQLAASGGLYLEEGNTRISLDPGPGSVVQSAKRKVHLTKLDAIVISHRHLDHSNDVNVMIEAMTDGGFRHRGRLFCPGDALDGDPVVLNYLRHFPQEIVRLKPETEYSVNGVTFTTSPAHVHQVETYGFRFGDRLGWVTDSEYYEGIAEQHKADVMVILLGGIATVLGLVSKRARFVPYPVVLALAGVFVGLLPGTPLPHIGGDILLVAFVPGLVFEAALTLDLAELQRRILPVGLLVTVGVALTVVLIGALTHLLVGFSWADGMLLGAILAATDPVAVG